MIRPRGQTKRVALSRLSESLWQPIELLERLRLGLPLGEARRKGDELAVVHSGCVMFHPGVSESNHSDFT
jgi:hypothetical protein